MRRERKGMQGARGWGDGDSVRGTGMERGRRGRRREGAKLVMSC